MRGGFTEKEASPAWKSGWAVQAFRVSEMSDHLNTSFGTRRGFRLYRRSLEQSRHIYIHIYI